MSLYRFTPGEKANQIPGRTWNRLVDGEERDSRRGPPSVRGPEGGSEGENPSPARVLLKNDSGSDAPTGGVLKLTGVVHEPAVEIGCEYSGPIFTGDTPAANEQHVAILSEPIADGFLGWGVIPNAAWAKVNVSDAGHTYAKPKASVDELESDAGTGFPIIWKESGTGAGKWAVVSLSKPGGTTLTIGVFIDTIPAASIVVAGSVPNQTLTITHGYTADAVIIAKKKADGTGWDHEEVDDETRLIGGVNLSFSRLRAAPTTPVAMLGYIESLTIADEPTDVFVPVNWEMRSLHGYVVGDIQVPFKDAASEEFQLNSEPCE